MTSFNSPTEVFTIPLGETGSEVTPLDLKYEYALLMVRISSISAINDVSNYLTLNIGIRPEDTLIPFYQSPMNRFIVYCNEPHQLLINSGAVRFCRFIINEPVLANFDIYVKGIHRELQHTLESRG